MQTADWIIIAVTAAIWVTGWFTTVVFALFLNPRMSPEDRKNWRNGLIPVCVLCGFLWIVVLPGYWRKYWFYRDIQTGKRPAWVVLDRNECNGGNWVLSDGLECAANVAGGDSTRATEIMASYLEESMTGIVEYRIQKIAPTPGEFSEWRLMPHDTTDYDDEEEGCLGPKTNYLAKVNLLRGKYRAQFRFPNRSGTMEEKSGVTFVVADLEEYADS